VAERVGVGDRAQYYDRSGVVRDMVQNHLLQLLAMVAMEPPSSADPESLRNKKVEVLKAIRRLEPGQAATEIVAGQYEGYQETDGVEPESNTSTYVAIRHYIDNWRWQGVPFYLRTGKALPIASSPALRTAGFRSAGPTPISAAVTRSPLRTVRDACVRDA
jgi:glucose-6-phosphate 1-dehydrogenase